MFDFILVYPHHLMVTPEILRAQQWDNPLGIDYQNKI